MLRTPDEVISRVKQTTDLVIVIKDRGVRLRKSGNVYKGLWHCFGYDQGGNVIQLGALMDLVGFL